jgi:hypothetical protein
MADRTITDSAGRTWTCTPAPIADGAAARQGQDVTLTCSTPAVAEPVEVTVGWQWETMAPNGLARLITQASPVPRD